MTEAVKRLVAGTEIARELWLLSGNECAWPNCTVRLLNENDDWVGEIAHIRGVAATSARHDPSMTNEERRAYENLLILCPTHHEQVDKPKGRVIHTVSDLERIKERHEDRFRRALTAIAESQDEYIDLTRHSVVRPCKTLARFLPDNDHEERMADAVTVNRFAELLGRVTLASRGLLYVVVEHKGLLGVEEAARRNGCSPHRIFDLVAELDRNRLAWVDPDDDRVRNRIVLTKGFNHPILDGWDFFESLITFASERSDVALKDVIVGLDFTLLD
uniref:HNH endonuclease n=1 Tax=Streptomyces sp. NBC_00049 TaxID=2903617 RepID=A0AAU2K049_9ACTN